MVTLCRLLMKIIDPFAGTDLPQLPLLVGEEFVEITAKSTNRISLASFKEKHPKNSANVHFWASMYKMYPQFQTLLQKN